MEYLIFSFYIIVPIIMSRIIISRIYFIIPMEKKYNILASDMKKTKTIYIFEVLLILLNLGYFCTAYLINKIYFIILITIYIVYCMSQLKKYKKYKILDYIEWYSADLFDWDKIYALRIEEKIKRKCFEIHGIDYDTYKQTYLNNLQLKQNMLELEIKKIDKEKQQNT